MKVIPFTRPDGGVSIVVPSTTYVAKLMDGSVPGLTLAPMDEDEAIAFIQAKDVPANATNVEVMEASAIPGFDVATGVLHHHEFRDALVKPGAGPPTVDMPKARIIHTDRITRAKRALARELLERETTGENVTAEKAVLAAINVQPAINSAANPNALSAIRPAALDRFLDPKR